jgi:hypothetical protein
VTPRNGNVIGRMRWWLLLHIYDRRLVYWAFVATGWLPRSSLYKPLTLPACDCEYCRGVPGAEYQA